MDEILELCVEHGGQTQCFPVVYSQFGFSYRITVTVEEVQVIFEPDEEREWRARIENNSTPNRHVQELIPLIAAELKKLLQ